MTDRISDLRADNVRMNSTEYSLLQQMQQDNLETVAVESQPWWKYFIAFIALEVLFILCSVFPIIHITFGAILGQINFLKFPLIRYPLAYAPYPVIYYAFVYLLFK